MVLAGRHVGCFYRGFLRRERVRAPRVGAMIELGNTRYAAGLVPARAAMLVAAVLCASYLAMAVLLCASLVIQSRPLPRWLTVSFSGGLVGLGIALLGAAFVVMMLHEAHSQVIEDVPAAQRAARRRKPMVRAVFGSTANPVLGFFVVFVLVALAGLAAKHPGYFAVSAALRLIAVAAMAINGRAALRMAWQMCRQAKVDGEIDLFRGFDWNRVDIDDRSQFRMRYLSRSWKHPKDVTERGEAQKLAERARRVRFRWMTAAALAAVIVLARVDPKAVLGEIFRPAASEWTAILAMTLIAGIVLGPNIIQNHMANLGDLAKDYEQCEKTIDPGIIITRNLRPFVTAIPTFEPSTQPTVRAPAVIAPSTVTHQPAGNIKPETQLDPLRL